MRNVLEQLIHVGLKREKGKGRVRKTGIANESFAERERDVVLLQKVCVSEGDRERMGFLLKSV
jgi:hypothetical protein